MGSVTHVEDGKKELVCDVHRLARLGVHLVDFNEGVVIIQNGSKLSLVSYVKAKQDLDPIIIELKQSFLKKPFRLSPKGNMVFFVTKVDYVFQMSIS